MSDIGIPVAELGLSQKDIVIPNTAIELDTSSQVSDIISQTPDQALQALSLTLQHVESEKNIVDKFQLIDKITTLLKTAGNINSPDAYRITRDNAALQKLGIRNHILIRNTLPRDLHNRIIKYLGNIGIQITNDERQALIAQFDEQDRQKKLQTMNSYASHGLLTLNGIADACLVVKTSATPGDNLSSEDIDVDSASANYVRGYELTKDTTSQDLFYGRNSFFNVVLERGNEDIAQASKLPKEEIENRLRNSMLFVINSKKLNLSRRADNVEKEDIVTGNIPPDQIDYVLVDASNYLDAQKAFNKTHIKIIQVESTIAQIEGLYEGPYTLPNYKDSLAGIIEQEGSVWSHIARLPEDTYPKYETHL